MKWHNGNARNTDSRKQLLGRRTEIGWLLLDPVEDATVKTIEYAYDASGARVINHVDRGRFGATHLTRPYAIAGFCAVFIPSDQTIRYLADDGGWVVNHAQARIFTDAKAAEEIATREQGYVEHIGDLVEFRLREDTW